MTAKQGYCQMRLTCLQARPTMNVKSPDRTSKTSCRANAWQVQFCCSAWHNTEWLNRQWIWFACPCYAQPLQQQQPQHALLDDIYFDLCYRHPWYPSAPSPCTTPVAIYTCKFAKQRQDATLISTYPQLITCMCKSLLYPVVGLIYLRQHCRWIDRASSMGVSDKFVT